MPQVCEGCTAKTKVKLLAERGAFFVTPRSGLAGASSLMLFLLQAHYKSGSGQLRVGRGQFSIDFLLQFHYKSGAAISVFTTLHHYSPRKGALIDLPCYTLNSKM